MMWEKGDLWKTTFHQKIKYGKYFKKWQFLETHALNGPDIKLPRFISGQISRILFQISVLWDVYSLNATQ